MIQGTGSDAGKSRFITGFCRIARRRRLFRRPVQAAERVEQRRGVPHWRGVRPDPWQEIAGPEGEPDERRAAAPLADRKRGRQPAVGSNGLSVQVDGRLR